MSKVYTFIIANEFLSEIRNLLNQYQLNATEIEGPLESSFEIQVFTDKESQAVQDLSNAFNRLVRDKFLREYSEEIQYQRTEKLRRKNLWRVLTFRRKLTSL